MSFLELQCDSAVSGIPLALHPGYGVWGAQRSLVPMRRMGVHGLMIQILAGLITYLLLAIYCHEQHGESVSIHRVRQLRNQILDESRMTEPQILEQKQQHNKSFKNSHASP